MTARPESPGPAELTDGLGIEVGGGDAAGGATITGGTAVGGVATGGAEITAGGVARGGSVGAGGVAATAATFCMVSAGDAAAVTVEAVSLPAPTVTTLTAVWSPLLAVIATIPFRRPVTRPLVETVATVVSAEIHCASAARAYATRRTGETPKFAVSLRASPILIVDVPGAIPTAADTGTV